MGTVWADEPKPFPYTDGRGVTGRTGAARVRRRHLDSPLAHAMSQALADGLRNLAVAITSEDPDSVEVVQDFLVRLVEDPGQLMYGNRLHVEHTS